MLADDVACNPRNGFPSTIYANSGKQLDLYGSGVDAKKTGVDEAVGVEVDYRGYEVNVESFLRVLTGERDESTRWDQQTDHSLLRAQKVDIPIHSPLRKGCSQTRRLTYLSTWRAMEEMSL